MGGFSWLARRPAAAGDPLTLSSPPKATLLWIILWRCSNIAGHGIARTKSARLPNETVPRRPVAMVVADSVDAAHSAAERGQRGVINRIVLCEHLLEMQSACRKLACKQQIVTCRVV